MVRTPEQRGEVNPVPADSPISLKDARKKREQEKRAEALSLKLAGLTVEQIAERLGISEQGVNDLIKRTLARANENAELTELRDVENARLDRAQAAIWSAVLRGDVKAVDAFLKISAARRQLNGMNAPMEVKLAVNVRHEMESALAQLEAAVLGNVVMGQVISSVDERTD